MGSSSQAQTQTSQSTTNVSRNLNIQDTSGITVGEAGGNVTVVQTDQGALAAGADVARRAIDFTGDLIAQSRDALNRGFDFGESALSSGERVARAALDSNGDANARALDFGGDAISAIQRVNSDSLSLLGGLVSESIDASRTLARDSADANSRTVSDAIAGFGALAKQSTASTDDRVAKVAGYAVLAIVAAVVLPQLFKGGGKAVLA